MTILHNDWHPTFNNNMQDELADSWNFAEAADFFAVVKDVAAWDNFVEKHVPFADIDFVICDYWDSHV